MKAFILQYKKQENESSRKPNTCATDNYLSCHLQYHPKDVSRQKIQNIYEDTCVIPDKHNECLCIILTTTETLLRIKGLTVAYFRSKTLKDYLVQSRFLQTSQHNIETTLREPKNSTSNCCPKTGFSYREINGKVRDCAIQVRIFYFTQSPRNYNE